MKDSEAETITTTGRKSTMWAVLIKPRILHRRKGEARRTKRHHERGDAMRSSLNSASHADSNQKLESVPEGNMKALSK